MSYQVLARKWRPRNFAELMGQEHVVRALTGGLKEGRLHHAFLFTGTRGVGKTTIARIIAKALNCEEGVSAAPCGQCGSCRDIDAGRFPDLIEIDAASRTKVDDTREILDNVIYAPSRGRFKVYLIDEVHMLSTHSFNALLKTLEEPPEHVKFILATTDPQKLPVTVLSRCLKFHLKRLTITQISQQMQHIMTAEGIQFEGDAIDELARAADGSMRDGLSLLDQALAFGGGSVQTDATREMLGTLSNEAVVELLEALADGSAALLSDKLAALADFGGSYVQVLARLMEHLHQLAFLQIVGANAKQLHEVPPRLAALANRFSPQDLQIKFQFANLGAKEVASAPDAKIAFEMCLLRMLAFAELDQGEDTPPKTGDVAPGKANGDRAERAIAGHVELIPEESDLSRPARESVFPASPQESRDERHGRHESSVAAEPQYVVTVSRTDLASALPYSDVEQWTPERDARHQTPADVASAERERDYSADQQTVESVFPASPRESTPEARLESTPEDALPLAQRWRRLVEQLNLAPGPLREFAHNALAQRWQQGVLSLIVDAAHASLAGTANVQALTTAIASQLSRSIALDIKINDVDLSDSPAHAHAREHAQRAAQFHDSITERPLVHALISQLDARVVPGSVYFHGQ
jgi:DNA polymerase III subunit gamma/tau